MSYTDYAKLYSEVTELTKELSNKKRGLQALVVDLRQDGRYGVDFTSHGFEQISERLEELANDNQIINDDVYQSLLVTPSNIKSFIISLLSRAHEEGSVTQKKNPKVPGSAEYHYKILIKKWVNFTNKVIEFTCIVENGWIKTGYFNYVNGSDGK